METGFDMCSYCLLVGYAGESAKRFSPPGGGFKHVAEKLVVLKGHGFSRAANATEWRGL
jgi:hypothetical protein